MKYKTILSALCLLGGLACLSLTPAPKPVKVEMVTDHGTIRIMLYNETPLHRDNFIKLVKEHYYDSLLFHRVIRGFMIQGGDPDSKRAKQGVELGNGGPSYTIPAEFNRNLFHRKGVLAAARESDLDNPSQASSGSQFYIVQGRVFPDSLLTKQETRITKMKAFNKVINKPENISLLQRYKKHTQEENFDSVKVVTDAVNLLAEKEIPNMEPYKFTEAERQIYSTIGGTPHLDQSYTIFGEVYEGMDIVEKIAEEKTDERARPVKDVRILRVSIIP
jgi:cyclophilin family peptidyl-prolyl cis-trans isomerase